MIPRSIFHSIFLFMIGLPQAQAEYRAYELVIVDSTNGSSRTALSTLDDRQYRYYNVIKQTESISIKATWMCYPRSDYYKTLCPNPGPRPPRKPAQS